MIETISEKKFFHHLRPRHREWHKALSGHVLVVGGEQGYSGAPRMAAEAALRVGAGLVSVATRPENATMMNIMRPELMCHAVNDVKQLAPLLDKAQVVIMGPGLGQSAWSKSLWTYIQQCELPMVVDADALNLLAHDGQYNDRWVLTPHPGEAGRLLQQSAAQIQQNRPLATEQIQQKYGGVIVLKGAGTLVLSTENGLMQCELGNPGMATAGMGDVLSGVIGGLMAQKIPPADAACLGVYLHARAGDLAAVTEGERGLLAMDILPWLRKIVNDLL